MTAAPQFTANIVIRGRGGGVAAFWTTTDDQRALGLRSYEDGRGRNWVIPEGHCGVCGATGGHLPDCPATGA